MILPDFKAFPRTGRIIGLDWGARRTGVAVSDASREFIFTRPAIVTPGENMRNATELCTYVDLPICFIDENLTSFAAQESMGRVRVSDIKCRLDSEAARVILENAIAIINRIRD